MDKPTLTHDQQALISRMTEAAGELLFEATSGPPFAPLIGLAETLGQLYGEAIRQCKDHKGLVSKVHIAFASGVAVKPNFGREEDDKSPGQVAYEGQPHGAVARPWAQLHNDTRLAYENEAMTRAEAKERDAEAMKKPKTRTYNDVRDEYGEAYEVFHTEQRESPNADYLLSAVKAYKLLVEYREMGGEALQEGDGFGLCVDSGMALLEPHIGESWRRFFRRHKIVGTDRAVVERHAERSLLDGEFKAMARLVANRRAGPCQKCTGTGNMSLLGEYEKCDAC